MDLLQYPLVRFTLFYVFGIIAGAVWPTDFIGLIAGFAVALMLLGLQMVFVRKSNHLTIGYGITLLVSAFLLGMVVQKLHRGDTSPRAYVHLTSNPSRAYRLQLTVRERLKPTRHERYIALVNRVNETRTDGKVLLHWYAQPLTVGQTIWTVSNIRTGTRPKNPGQFDYTRYLEEHGILAQTHVRTAILSRGTARDLFYFADVLRTTVINHFKAAGLTGDELAVLNALLLGQQQEISQEVVRDYRFAGAVHILSVSGLHVGFLMLLVNWLVRRLPRSRWGRWLKIATIVSVLWAFAFVAGLSPSVVRSVTMFSFVALGLHLDRDTNVFHTLVVSMLLILLVAPSFLFDVGFQLSYLAVFFIVWLQPMFQRIWSPQNRIVRYGWQIITVSFAAQLGTLPLTLYYFHQFPGLFFVTNLLVLPLLSVIMVLGLVALVPAMFTVVPVGLAAPLGHCVRFLNAVIAYIAHFEQFVWRDIPFSKLMMLASYAAIFAWVIWFRKQNFVRISTALAATAVLQIAIRFETRPTAHDWLILYAPRHSVLVERNGTSAEVFTDSIDEQTLQNFRTAHFIGKLKMHRLPNVLWADGKKILVIDSSAVYPKCRPDVVLLRQSPRLHFERLLQDLKPSIVIADASNYKSAVARWKRTARQQKIPFRAIAETGYCHLSN